MTVEVKFKAGEVIFRQAYPADHAYIIRSGRVEIYKEYDGEEEHIAILEPGQMFGELGVLDDAPRSASARAMDDIVLQIVDL